MIVRSNGVVTYVGKDIAYQFWKLGLLGRDFQYRIFADGPDGPLWATCSANGEKSHPPFGGAAYVYNVIDVRQSYLQKLLKQALVAAGHPEGADRSHHFSYEMVALSHATARELGHAPAPDSEDAKRPFVEVSGRKGLGVKADDLLDTLMRNAGREVATRNPELSEAERDRIGAMIGIAAVRYFLIKFSRGKIIAFDLDEALSFEGESGPYIQYAVVRANNIFQKVQQRDKLDEPALLASLRDVSAAELTGENGSHELWSLVLDASRLDEIVEQVVKTLEFSVLAKYAFSLAQAFNAFYHRSQILNEERDDVRRWRAGAVIYLRDQLTPRPRPDGDCRSSKNVMAIIAIARCSKLPDYEESIRRAGGEPWVVESGIERRRPTSCAGPAASCWPAAATSIRRIFGETPHPTFDAAESGRDDYEIELIRLATERDLPLLAICRGIQVLNVARGGTLVQDIPTELPGTLEHKLAVPPHNAFDLAHEVWIEKDSLLSRLAGDSQKSRDTVGREQPASPVGQGARRRTGHDRDRARWRDRSDRGSIAPLLPGRSVASGELLSDR